jgi:AraC-like DNA-binding protein
MVCRSGAATGKSCFDLRIKFSEETIAGQDMRTRIGTEVGPPLLVDAVWARRVVAELDRVGFPASELLGALGLHRDQLAGPDAHIPFHAHVKLLENAARALREPCFGFRLGSEVELTEAGLVAYVTLNSPDLGAALRNACRYLTILTEGTVAHLRQEAGEVKLLFSFVDPIGTTSPQLHEFGITVAVRMCEAMTAHRVRPLRVELHHDTACPLLARRLALPVEVNQPHSALVLAAASLTVPVVNADGRLLDLLRRYADDLLARRACKDDLVARAERWILENLHTGDVGVARLARGLAMSGRTLARRLAEDGLTPAGLVEELRRQLAQKYLAERTFSLGRIAYLLGYSDRSTFTRVFRRWTGSTPSKWRSKLPQRE